ncbi:MAG: 1,2-dihydroxy-3-keto-5-methylthiopentene dioxygenase [Candidatus Eremiobacteraeota bacterium]|jgi:1,2-dihydroxy-3-keto-5-methylthiopentene dioxygenase|nr:1,2-dihydroxy-3-keto-5-methylthiopentene dioxygenase [Candidatus Eremiobacteraeota bacterium]
MTNATLTSTLRVYDDRSAEKLVDTNDRAEIVRILNDAGVRFERWEASVPLARDADQETILAAYADDVARLKRENGYTTADVLRLVRGSVADINPIRNKFLEEHTHSEDEVRFFVEGDAAFYLRINGKVHQAICVAGDLIGVPAGTQHWFDMGPDPQFTAIRLFENTEGWTPNYTGDPIAARFPKYE